MEGGQSHVVLREQKQELEQEQDEQEFHLQVGVCGGVLEQEPHHLLLPLLYSSVESSLAPSVCPVNLGAGGGNQEEQELASMLGQASRRATGVTQPLREHSRRQLLPLQGRAGAGVQVWEEWEVRLGSRRLLLSRYLEQEQEEDKEQEHERYFEQY